MLSSDRALTSAVLGNQGGLLRKGDRVLIDGATLGVNTAKPFQGEHLLYDLQAFLRVKS